MHEASTLVTKTHVITSMSDSLYNVHGIRNKHVLPPLLTSSIEVGPCISHVIDLQGFSVADFLEGIQKKADADRSDAEKKNKPS